MINLSSKKCIPCEGNIPPLSKEKIAEYIKLLAGEWQLIEENNIVRIKKRFKFASFIDAIAFVNKVAELAEKEGHHPNIFIFYNKVDIELYTHSIRGLHDNDFIIAAKINEIF